MPCLHWTEWRSGRLRFLERQLFPRHFVDHQLASVADASARNHCSEFSIFRVLAPGCARSRQFSGIFTISRKFGPVISKVKCINLALQGGSAHGAFTWGVLDRLIEEPRIEVEGVSAMSAGAMNATVIAHGLTTGGRKGAREAAMMFPTAAPMILTFHKVQAGKRQRGEAFVSTWIFVAAYLLVWSLSGVAAYAGALAAEAVAARTALSPASAARVGGAVLVAAGLYQLTPLKDLCLSKCRTPITFIMTSWRDGTVGALRMGLLHGAYCLGCCWLLFVILFPLGIMNIAAMAVITVVIFAEKTLPWGRTMARVMAVALIAYGSVVVAAPQLLPTFPAAHNMDTPADMPMQMEMPKPK